MDLSCPSCGSEATQLVSLAHEAGHSTSSGGGILFLGGELGVAGIGSCSQTALSARLAPPRKASGHGWIVVVLAFILSTIALGMWCNPKEVGSSGSVVFQDNLRGWAMLVCGTAILLGIWGVVSIAAAIHYNHTTHVARMAKWRAGYICHRCGTVFRPHQQRQAVESDWPEIT